ncbi:protein of unknown function [Denitratisoma oestradiolicum]|uniref:Uncharacterized protein n=1 Tax=Denitratisoma oestradiolicum TaxID=311182 RepID=A0A6S6YDD7_9PROT|nr:protein of unknown function [Denitratisoma oestradiolicum]
MAGGQLHTWNVGGIPGADDMTARVRVFFQSLNQLADLVDLASLAIGPVAPLMAIHRPQVAVGVGPFVPDGDPVVFQVADVGVSLEEPEQLVDDGAGMQLLGGQQRKSCRQVETHLPAEHRASAGAGAVGFFVAVLEHVLHQVEVLAHGVVDRRDRIGADSNSKGRSRACLLLLPNFGATPACPAPRRPSINFGCCRPLAACPMTFPVWPNGAECWLGARRKPRI